MLKILGRTFLCLLISGAAASAARSEMVAGTVNAAGTRLRVGTAASGRNLNLFTTSQQAAEEPRSVNLAAYRRQRVAVICQVVNDQDAWGCSEIGRLVRTTNMVARRR